MREIIGIIVTAIIYTALSINIPSERTVDFQLKYLCSIHTDKECADIIDYCREALSTGNECYIVD